MATEQSILRESYVAAEDLTNDQYRFVVLTSTGVRRPNSEAEPLLGILQNAPAVGEAAEVMEIGRSKLQMNDAASVSDFIKAEYVSAADAGKGKSAAADLAYARAMVIEASGAEDDLASVLLIGQLPGLSSESAEQAYLVVSLNGSDTEGSGSPQAPYLTITKAFSEVTTDRKRVLVYAGDYEEAASLTWPDVNGVELVAVGGTVTITAPDADQVIKIDPAAAAGTWSATLDGICPDAEDGQVGLQVDNASVGKRINLYLKNFSANQETATDASIDINRTGAAGNAIRVYADGDGGLVEGLVTVITENTDDRFRFKNMRLVGGLTVVGAIACEVTLINTGISAKTLDGANKLTNIGCWYETDANPNVYTNFANAFATY